VQNFDNLRKWWEGDGQKLAAQVSFVMDFIGAAIQSMIFEIQLVIWLAQAMGLAFSLLGTALHDAALRIQDGFNIIAGAADAARRAVDGLAQRITSLPGVTGIISATETLAGGNLFGRAAGGAMVPNAIYDVGEDGPERVFMGQHGAVVVPGTPDGRRSGNTIHVHINGSGLNSDQVGKVVMATLRQHVLMYG
jgi:hypothetical protein